jgi:FKBP-type peptidyl-prolyl cis-trans isomerase
MREFLRRGGWIFLALLFIVTALGVGVYAFVVNTGSNPNDPSSNYIKCPTKKVGEQKPGTNKKYEGAKLVDFTPVQHVGYLQCWDTKVGNGATAAPSSTITATYTGAVASTGIIFQSSLDTGQPFQASLNNGVIPGWTAGIPGMKVGGTRRLLIPAKYAYGSQSVAGIPPNSDLVFDVTLLLVK